MENVLVDRGVTVVALARSYDMDDMDGHRRLDDVLRQQTESAEPPLIVLDMSRTVSMDSTLLGLLFAAEKRVRTRRGRMAVCGANVFCADVLRVVNINALFPSFATRDEAVDGLLQGTQGPATDGM